MAYWILDVSATAEAISSTALSIAHCLREITGWDTPIVRLTAKQAAANAIGSEASQSQAMEQNSLNSGSASVSFTSSADKKLLQNLFSELRNVADAKLDKNGIVFRGIFVVITPSLNNTFWNSLHRSQPDLASHLTKAVEIYHHAEPSGSFLGGLDEQLSTQALALPHFLLLLDLIARRNRVVIFATSPLKPSPTTSNESTAFKSLSRSWQLRVECLDLQHELRPYLLTRIGRDIFRVAPMIHERRDNRFVASKQITEDCGLSLNPLKDEYWDWFRQEFGARQMAQAFLGNVWYSLCGREEPQKDHQATEPLLPWQAQVAIGVARMCRRMSSWTLEGVPFECTVVLQTISPSDHFKTIGADFHALMDIVPTCPFNFDHEDQIRNYAETAQSHALFMLVYAGDGNLHHIATVDANHSPVSMNYYTKLAGQNSMVFRIRPPGRVDIYTSRGLVMSHDSFHWIDNPLRGLGQALERHFDNVAHDREKCISCMQEAVQMLLDTYQSSIFILVDKKDEEHANRLTRESLRPSIMWSTSGMIRIHDLDPAALAGLLHLDGAHLIGESGDLQAISRRINAGVRRHTIELSADEYERIVPNMHMLPRGAFVDQSTSSTSRNSAAESPRTSHANQLSDSVVTEHRLLFSQRVEPRWVDDWFDLWGADSPTQNNRRWLTASVKEKIRQAVTKELVHLKVIKIDGNWALVDYVRRRLLKKHQLETLRLLTPQKSILVTTPFTIQPLKEQSNPSASPPKIEERKDELLSQVQAILNEVQESAYHVSSTADYFYVGELLYTVTRSYDALNIPGLAYEGGKRFYVAIDQFSKVLSADTLPRPIYANMSSWERFGPNSEAGATGTGTRAAQELSARLPHSTVVKVSASGKLKVYGPLSKQRNHSNPTSRTR